jgi:hypothetical protein
MLCHARHFRFSIRVSCFFLKGEIQVVLGELYQKFHPNKYQLNECIILSENQGKKIIKFVVYIRCA